MDNFYPIFPSKQHEENQLGFENTISTFEFQPPPQQQQFITQQNPMPNHALPDPLNMDTFFNYTSFGGDFHYTTFDDNNLGNKNQHSSSASASRNLDFHNYENKQKKIIHKETERQRRCQMANLYASLKSLLPHDSINKGRQATSELIHEAENYIRLKQKSIEELSIERDGLKKCQNNNINESSSSCNFPVDISVRSYLGGMEILISVDLRMDGFQLSKVLELLLAQGLCVVSYVCSRIDGNMLHTIQTEVCHLEVTDAYDMKQKLIDIIIRDS